MRYAFSLFLIFTLLYTAPAFSDDETEQEAPETDTRGTDRAGQGDAFDAWGRYFGRDLPDPLDAGEMQEYQENKEDYDQRVQAAAEFTDAASSVVSALPSGSLGSTVASTVVSEGAQAVVEAETTEKSGFFRSVWNGLKSFVGWVLSPFS